MRVFSGFWGLGLEGDGPVLNFLSAQAKFDTFGFLIEIGFDVVVAGGGYIFFLSKGEFGAFADSGRPVMSDM